MNELSKLQIAPNGENDLLFPVIDCAMSPPSIRSMDEIDAWIEHDYALFYDEEQYGREKRRLSVNGIFVLK